jgi:regulator of protease activity HflC (stomatin/prohibitin superfamily)
MRRIWVIGAILTFCILLLIAFLGEPMGAMLGMLVLLSAITIGALVSRVVFVRQRTALVILSARHDAVLRVVMGPGSAFLHPFREKEGPVMDTGPQTEHVHVHDVLQFDQQPATLRFDSSVIYRLAPDSISVGRLGEFLPFLTDSQSDIIQYWTNYYLRNLVADRDLGRILGGRRSRLELHLNKLLTGHLAQLGLAVESVQVVLRPPAGLEETMTNAAQQKVGIKLQAEQLAAILNALTDRSDQASSLARLELARSLGRSGQVWTGIDVASQLNGQRTDPDQSLSLALPEFLNWPEPS